jgi:serine/threonine protein kinase
MNAPPVRLGRYEVKSALGQGAMGIVYEALDPALQRAVAIKTLRREQQSDEVLRRFRTEAVAVGRLSHPNIVSVFDVGEQEDLYFIAMELVRGQELSTLLHGSRPLPRPQAVQIIVELLQALDYAHGQGVLHRDVKPSNVLLTDDGHVKLTDFGIARVADGDHNRTQVGTMMGTPSYMAPEQVRGEQAGPAADLYAAGVILYEMLTGTLPFGADSTVALMHGILNDEVLPPSRRNPQVPRHWDAPVLRALAKRPDLRHASAAEFAAAVRAAAAADVLKPRARIALWMRPAAALVALARRLGGAGGGAPPLPPRPPPDVHTDEPEEPARPRRADLTMLAPAPNTNPAPLMARADQTLLIRPAAQGSAAVSLLVVRSDVASMVGQRFAVGAHTRIGRGDDAEIVLPDLLLSRQHAVVQRGERGMTITDLGSVNGTHVNGQRLQRDRPYPLLPGTHVGVGATVLAVAIDAHQSLAQLAGAALTDRYRLEDCLHASPKGALYRAVRQGSQLAVAVKLLAPGFSQWPGYRESFEAEAEIAAGLQHPHICRLEDHGEADITHGAHTLRVPFLVYEMMAGGSLAGRLAGLAAVPTQTLLEWLRDLASALDHVHRKSLVHGGLKPSAVCFDADDNVYLTDFAHGRTQPGQAGLFGTPAYMAPELWQGHEPHPASDRYALGVLAYRLIAGAFPYDGQDDPVMRERNLARLPPPLHPAAGGRTFGPAVTAALTRALAADPGVRYPSATEFAQQLARAVSSGARSPSTHPVFISYERTSATAWVTLIAQELTREHGVRCFVDTAALDRAESFPARIRNAIRDCDVFVCILGPETLRSKWVRDEIAVAWRHRRTMVPVLLEGFTDTPEDLKVRSIRALLHYGGERILDRQNLFVREAVQRIAQRVKSGLSDA